MNMVFHPEQIPFLLGLGIVITLAVYSFQRAHMHMATTFGWLMVCVGIWLATYLLDLANTDYHAKLFWLKVKYIGATSSSVLWLVLAMVFTGNERWLGKPFYFVTIGWSLIVVSLAMTNEWHGLFWADYYVDPNQIESVTVHGPLFAVYALVGASVGPISIVIYASHLFKVQRFYRNRAIMFMLAGLLPLAGITAQANGFTLIDGVDHVPLMIVVGCMIYAVAIFRYHALDVLKVAQNLVIDNVKAGVIVVDHTEKILGFNPYAAELFVDARVNAELATAIPALAKHELCDDLEFEIFNGVEEPQCFMVKVSQIENPRVGNLGHALILLNITERKAAEDALQQSLETRSRFFANMSHELRTPLHGISGYLELIQRQTTDVLLLDYANKADASAKLLLSLINDVLDLSRIESNNLSFEAVSFDLRHVLQNVEASLELQAQEKGLTFDVWFLIEDGLSEATLLVGDPLRLNQVLNNLVGNAVKFTSSGSVSLGVLLCPEGESQVLANFSVSDTGPGIPQDKWSTLFEPFTQMDTSTTRTYGGSGLGLAIAQQLVHSMGGKITVSSELDGGSVFSFSLLLPVGDPTKVLENKPEAAYSMLNGLSVLVVDDASVNRQIASEYLNAVGVNVVLASNGEEAIEKITHDSFAAVLLDIHMPTMDGHETVRYIREQLGLVDLPVIAMTASAFDEDRIAAFDAGMSDFVAKPFKSEEIYSVLTKWAGTEVSNKHHQINNNVAPIKPSGVNLMQELYRDAALRLAGMSDTPEDWHEYIHFIKGSAGFLGATGLLNLAKEVEGDLPENLSVLRQRFAFALGKLESDVSK